MTAQTVQITLHGSDGSRTTQVAARGGFTSRHVIAPREQVPSIFSPVETPDTPAVETPAVETPAPFIETTTPVETPQNAIGDRMTALIAEVDSITSADPKPEADAVRRSDAVRRPAADRRVEKAVEHLNKRDAERSAYDKLFDVEAKRGTAMQMLAEMEVQDA